MKVLKTGTRVSLKINESISGIITAVCIRFNNVSYEFTYLLNGSITKEWVNEEELITAEAAKKLSIGYKNN